MNTSITPVPLTSITQQGRVVTGPLTQADYEEMKRHTRDWRDTLLLMLFRATGFRPVEVSRILYSHLDRQGPAYLVWMRRAKKRKRDLPYEAIYLNPPLGQALFAYAVGQHVEPDGRVFAISTRQMERVVGAAGLAALGRHVMPKEFRRLYIVTVAEIAAQVVGYAPQHMEIAQKMVGHERVNTTWDWYVMLSTDQRRAIQERVPV